MGQNSHIEWTDHTFNPWHGCVKVSPGCAHCYAETLSKRFGNSIWGLNAPRKMMSDAYWSQPLKWNTQALNEGVRRRVFCASMADVFEDHADVVDARTKLWKLIDRTPALDWLLLTKRPENMLRFAPWKGQWPTNVWAMTSVENQAMAARRLPFLLKVPAVVRGISVEPLLDKVDLSSWLEHIDWVIVGGESGTNARPMHPGWVAKIRQDCAHTHTAFFFKQWGQWSPLKAITDTTISARTFMVSVGKGNAGRVLDGRTWDELPKVTTKNIGMRQQASKHRTSHRHSREGGNPDVTPAQQSI